MINTFFTCDECNRHCVIYAKQPRSEPTQFPKKECLFHSYNPIWKEVIVKSED